jgi:hypothetical protein
MTQQDKIDLIFAAFDKGDVSITLFAKLTRVSRVSLHAWKRGNRISDQLRLNLAVNVASRILHAVEAGRLPLKEKLKFAEKKAAVQRIVRDA